MNWIRRRLDWLLKSFKIVLLKVEFLNLLKLLKSVILLIKINEFF